MLTFLEYTYIIQKPNDGLWWYFKFVWITLCLTKFPLSEQVNAKLLSVEMLLLWVADSFQGL